MNLLTIPGDSGEPLVDRHGRRVRNMRISVTDRCNFRCTYCMPAGGLPWLPKPEILTYEEIARLVRVAAAIGIEEVRLTGGEPLVRRDLPELVRQLSPIPGVKSLSLTTNGFLLSGMIADLAAAGLTRINVSLDSLVRERFAQLTRRDALERVMQSLEMLERFHTIRPIKVNAVAIRGFTEEEVPRFAHLARRKPYVIRFIEFMPLDADATWTAEDVLTGAEIKRIMEEAVMPLVPVSGRDPSSTSRVYRFADGVGEVGFINPVSEPFCSTCDRIRVTADGQIRTCLFSHEETDLRGVLRNGGSDAEVAAVIRKATWDKELKHFINDGRFKRTARSMSMIGG